MYYKVLTEKRDWLTGHTTIVGEIVTPHERNTKYRYLADDVFSPVEVSKNNTKMIFGARYIKAPGYDRR